MFRLEATTDDGTLIYERFYVNTGMTEKEVHEVNRMYVRNEKMNRPIDEGGYGAITLTVYADGSNVKPTEEEIIIN